MPLIWLKVSIQVNRYVAVL